MKRRPFIATLGASAIAGCGGVFGGGRAERATRTPQPFRPVREPTAWPAPHYDGGHTRHAPDRAGVGLAEEWRYEPDSDLWPVTLPVAADGRLYIGMKRRATDPDDRRTRLLTLDTATGEVLWRRTFGGWSAQFSPPHGPLPVIYGDRVCFGPDSDAEELAVFSAATGSRQWTTQARDGQRLALPAAGLFHVIQTAGRRADTSTVVGLDPLTGASVWRTSFEGRPGYPSFDGSSLYYPLSGVGDENDHAVAIVDPTTGAERRRLEYNVQSFAPVRGGRLYTARWGGERILAIDTATGNTAWRADVAFHHDYVDDDGEERTLNARYRFGGLTDTRLIVLKHFHGYRSDELRAYDPGSGRQRWQEGFSGTGRVVTLNQPITVADTLYVTGTYDPHEESRSGFLRTYDIETGRRRNERPLREPCFIPPVVAGDRVFTVTTRGVTAYS